MMSGLMPWTLISICRLGLPFSVPATLKAMSPSWSSPLKDVGVSTAQLASSQWAGPGPPPGHRHDDHPERHYPRSVRLGRRGDPLWLQTLVADCPTTCHPSDSMTLRTVNNSNPPGVRTLLDARPHRLLPEIRRPARRARCVLGKAVVRDPGPRGHIGAHLLTAERPFFDRLVFRAPRSRRRVRRRTA